MSVHVLFQMLLGGFLFQCVVSTFTDATVLDMLVMADIGHPRKYASTLTSPFPMEKCSFEGAFSLYEGLLDFVRNQGVRPQAILALGDVGYCGGNMVCLNQLKSAFAEYTDDHVSEKMIFPAIGNHDVHYLGCSLGEENPVLSEGRSENHHFYGPCHYGTEYFLYKSEYQMTFQKWRQNWLGAFPGLVDNVIFPPPGDNPQGSSEWMAPLRYNLNMNDKSKVYFMTGLMSGAWAKIWNNDTPASAIDATWNETTAETECRFLRDSLAHGRRLGKTIFIYMTHDLDGAGCSDWNVLRQIDVWLYGHKHNQWQGLATKAGGAIQSQEQRHYPVKLLIGNGGFDEAHIDVVSFSRMREEHVTVDGKDRVRLSFDILDTCIAPKAFCPIEEELLTKSCWTRCKNMSGGYDGGGGPRRATPSKYHLGFVYDAPWKAKSSGVSPWERVQLHLLRKEDGLTRWVGLGRWSLFDPTQCLLGVENQNQAVVFTLYDKVLAQDGRSFTARLAIDDTLRAAVVEKEGWLSQHPGGFWHNDVTGEGNMRSTDGMRIQVVADEAGHLRLVGVDFVKDFLRVVDGKSLGLALVNVTSVSWANASTITIV